MAILAWFSDCMARPFMRSCPKIAIVHFQTRLSETWLHKYAQQFTVWFSIFDTKQNFTNATNKYIIIITTNIDVCVFLHQMDIIFTDLKPENIVFVDGRTKEVTTAGNVSCIIHTNIYLFKVQYYPIDTRIKIVDFGSAVYEPKYDPNNKASWKFRDGYTYLIQTRHYRAPEVVLEMPWKRPVDIWSIGCVILEFLHGSMVFNTHCSIDHLNQMQIMIGEIPQKLIDLAPDEKAEELFHIETMSLRMEDAKRSRVQSRSLGTYFDFKKPEHVDLFDLIQRMLKWFAADRITAEERLQDKNDNFEIKIKEKILFLCLSVFYREMLLMPNIPKLRIDCSFMHALLFQRAVFEKKCAQVRIILEFLVCLFFNFGLSFFVKIFAIVNEFIFLMLLHKIWHTY
ncbi:hypothetical protein RFI_24381 [Reticulomyxa filosa]|uniref:Protein kinase domain-containing protein n=1 Tax=Reticulomyxa filosa TaxID=46433 RepID=X6MHU8_RETFI|nr:hypothetical protein RFI_24381 [Reticulomyxa filosa]|eukprot:ETO12997.1 hypothetical protein RFI_24381 [Reticulomyxa filosa]